MLHCLMIKSFKILRIYIYIYDHDHDHGLWLIRSCGVFYSKLLFCLCSLTQRNGDDYVRCITSYYYYVLWYNMSLCAARTIS